MQVPAAGADPTGLPVAAGPGGAARRDDIGRGERCTHQGGRSGPQSTPTPWPDTGSDLPTHDGYGKWSEVPRETLEEDVV